MTQEHMKKSAHQEETDDDIVDAQQAQHADVIHDTDDLLDEIDGVLEKNAEDFVKAYVQKGGQ